MEGPIYKASSCYFGQQILVFERTKRTWDEVDVCSVNLSTLEVKEIIHEEDKPYRDPHARNVAILMMEKIFCSVQNVLVGGIIITMMEMEISRM